MEGKRNICSSPKRESHPVEPFIPLRGGRGGGDRGRVRSFSGLVRMSGIQICKVEGTFFPVKEKHLAKAVQAHAAFKAEKSVELEHARLG